MCFRLRMEYYSSKFGLFLTLTYDDDHLPPNGVCKRDGQLFLKRLRKFFPPGDIRYFLVAEYGDKTHRAHMHAIILWQKTLSYDPSIGEKIDKCWQNGFVHIGEVTDASIVYCTKYAMKRTLIPPGKNDVFRLMSKMNGGLGSEYLRRLGGHHLETMDFSRVSFNGYQSVFPRYYRKKLLQQIEPDLLVSEKRTAIVYDSQKKRIDHEITDKQNMLKLFSKSPRAKGHKSLEEFEKAFVSWYNEQTNTRNELTFKHVKNQNVL